MHLKQQTDFRKTTNSKATKCRLICPQLQAIYSQISQYQHPGVTQHSRAVEGLPEILKSSQCKEEKCPTSTIK